MAGTQSAVSEHQGVDHPVSHAASKKANELMAHTYAGLCCRPPACASRYGPWGRPDMALFLFTKAMLAGEPIQVFNNGFMVRDFTYVDDIIESLIRVLDKPAPLLKLLTPPSLIQRPAGHLHRVFNIGNSNPTPLMDYIEAVEAALASLPPKSFCRCSQVTSPPRQLIPQR